MPTFTNTTTLIKYLTKVVVLVLALITHAFQSASLIEYKATFQMRVFTYENYDGAILFHFSF